MCCFLVNVRNNVCLRHGMQITSDVMPMSFKHALYGNVCFLLFSKDGFFDLNFCTHHMYNMCILKFLCVAIVKTLQHKKTSALHYFSVKYNFYANLMKCHFVIANRTYWCTIPMNTSGWAQVEKVRFHYLRQQLM